MKCADKVFVSFVECGGIQSENLYSTYRTLSAAKDDSRKQPASNGPYVAEYRLVAVHKREDWVRIDVDQNGPSGTK